MFTRPFVTADCHAPSPRTGINLRIVTAVFIRAILWKSKVEVLRLRRRCRAISAASVAQRCVNDDFSERRGMGERERKTR